MLDDEEYEHVARAHQEAFELFKKRKAQKKRARVEDILNAICAEYTRFTGVTGTNATEVLHHRLSAHGPPCKQCGLPLRSPKARHCAACGADR